MRVEMGLHPMTSLLSHFDFGLVVRPKAWPYRLSGMSDVTQLLERVEQGDGTAAEELLPLVYEELRKLQWHDFRKWILGRQWWGHECLFQ